MKQDVELFCSQIPETWSVSRNPFLNAAVTGSGNPHEPQPFATFADAERQPVPGAKGRVVACGASNIPVAGEDLVVKKQLAEGCLLSVEGDEIVLPTGLWQFGSNRRCRQAEDQREQPQHMKTTLTAALFALVLCTSSAQAEIEAARDLMEANRYEEAMKELWPAARSGNADAEELIGVMYAMGLGVERDDQRAFEWYLRSAMKGHPGAQSGVGWYYEVGRGMPAPDLVRAYMWYTLSAIGGDPDAAISLEEVVKKMTKDEIEKAHILVGDYKVWMYPFN